MRHRVVPVALSALLLVGAACSDDANDAVQSSVPSSSPVGGQDSSAIEPASSAQTGDGPALGEVVRATLADGAARYTVQVGAQDAADDLLDRMLSGASDTGSTSSSDSTSSPSSTEGTSSSTPVTTASSAGDTTTPASDVPAATCDVSPGADAVDGEADVAQHLRCVALPDGQMVMVQDRDVFLFSDGSWSVVHVQFDRALAQLSPDALAALVDPVGVLESLVGGAGSVDQGADQVSTSALAAGGETTSGGSTGNSSGSTAGDSTGSSTADSSGSGSGGAGAADLRGTEGPDGFEYRVMVSVDDLDDPFLVALAQRAGAQTVQVHLVADQSSGALSAMTFDFPDAAATTGGATGSGTGGTSPTASAGSGTTVNGQGGGSGSTVAATASSLPQSEDSLGADSTLPEGAFDVPSVGIRFDALGGDVTLDVPTDAADLTLGDLAAALSVDLPPIGG